MSLQDDIARYEVDYHARMPARASTGDVAAAIAAGLERDKIIIDRADLPAEPSRALLRGGSNPYLYLRGDAESYMRWAHEFIAMALHLQARESEAAVLARRRDELARQYSMLGVDYERLSDSHRVVIDRTLAAEDRAAAAEAEVARLRQEANK